MIRGKGYSSDLPCSASLSSLSFSGARPRWIAYDLELLNGWAQPLRTRKWQGPLTFVLTRKGYSVLETTGNGAGWLCFRKITRMLLTLFSYSNHVGAFRYGPRWIRCQAPAVFSHVRFLPIRNNMADQKNWREIGSQRSFQERLMMVAPLDASNGPSIHT